MSARYHHGDLRRQLLDVAADEIAARGVAAVSLRELARRCGVSHAAPAHHFTDKTGLLTALAAQGFAMLAEALGAPTDDDSSPALAEMGARYVRFAVEHPAHFRLMFDEKDIRTSDADLVSARNAAGDQLRAGVASLPAAAQPADPATAALAAWSLAHGFATLYLGGNLPDGTDPTNAFLGLTAVMFQPS